MRCGVLFSGGKDSSFAIHSMVSRGQPICCLIAFSNCSEKGLFKKLDMNFVQKSAEALRLPLRIFKLSANPQRELLEVQEAFSQLDRDYGINAVVAGNTVSNAKVQTLDALCRVCGMQLVVPLLGLKKETVLANVLQSGFTVMPVKVNVQQDAGDLLGTELEKGTVAPEIMAPVAASILGSIVLDGPIFSKRIRLGESQQVWTALQGLMVLQSFELEEK